MELTEHDMAKVMYVIMYTAYVPQLCESSTRRVMKPRNLMYLFVLVSDYENEHSRPERHWTT